MKDRTEMPETVEPVTKIEPEASRVNVVGIPVDVCTRESACRKVLELAARRKGAYVCISTVHIAMESRDNPDFAAIVRAADLVTADGMPMFLMQKLQGAKQAARVRGVDLMQELFSAAEEAGASVGFYGGTQEVLDRIAARLKKDHPKLNVGYIYSPPFRVLTTEEDRQIVDVIAASGTEILFVGLGCPKQERWMASHRDELTAVMLGVGAAFDFYAGSVREAPEWIGRLGLEWLFRLLHEPRRLWRRYLLLNPRFMLLALLQLLHLKKFD